MEYKDREIKASEIALWALALIVIVIFGVSRIEKEEVITPNAGLQTRVLEDYLPESFRIEFILGCTGDDYRQYDYCACAFNYLDRNYTNSEIIKMSLEMVETDDLSDEMIDAVLVCEDLYVY